MTAPDANTTTMEGTISIVPAEGVQEAPLMAAFNCTVSHKIWADEKYLDHDTSTFMLSIEPAQDMLSDVDTGSYIEFKTLGIEWSVDYRNNPYQENSAVQVNYSLNLKVPDASVQAEAVMRITPQLTMTELSSDGAVQFETLSEERKLELLNDFVSNTITLMADLTGDPAVAVTSSPEMEGAPEPTSVPPMTE